MKTLHTLRFLAVAVSLLVTTAGVYAQEDESSTQKLDENSREKYISEIRNFKHDFLVKKLELTEEQQKEFFPLYDEMNKELFQINSESREVEKKIESDVSDPELEAAAIILFNQKLKEGQVENQYFDKFKKILTNRQLVNLKKSERIFTQKLMRQHRKVKRHKAAEADSLRLNKKRHRK